MKYNLPTTIEIPEKSLKIRSKGDYRVILDCFEALNDNELEDKERIMACLIIFYEDLQDIEDIPKLGDVEQAIKKMFEFFNCGNIEDDIGAKVSYKLIDWNKDSQLICSAINNVYKGEIRAVEYCHWWTFMGYYLAIGECTLSHIVNIRHKIATHQKLEKYEQEFRRDNPQYFNIDYRSQEQIKNDELVRSIWNGGV